MAGIAMSDDAAERSVMTNEQLDKMALERLIAAQTQFELDKSKAIAEHCRWRIGRENNHDKAD